MQLLRDDWAEADILAGLLPPLTKSEPEPCRESVAVKHIEGVIVHPRGQYYFIPTEYKRFKTSILLLPIPATIALPPA